MRIAFSILLLVAACAPYQSANEAPEPIAPITEGDRLRVTHDARCCTSPSIGVVQSLSRDSLVLQSTEDSARLAIARANIFQIERWNGTKTRMGRGALLGFFVGAGLGLLIGSMYPEQGWRALAEFYDGLAGGIGGALVGLVFGSRYGTWETIPRSLLVEDGGR